MTNNSIITDVRDIDWEAWVPAERAVLCFIKVDNRLMLIHKKRGLGKGKINAPGGRIEKNELALDAAIRETQEEIGLTPYNLVDMGELHFIFTDGYSLHGIIFFADSYSGTPVETDEAVPFWCDIDKIPYDNMWEDDHFWLPLLLEGKKMKGYFIFDNDKMLSHSIDVI